MSEKVEYSNPLAPADHFAVPEPPSSSRNHPLTNDDFRKLMMTPRVGGGQKSPGSSGGQSFSRRAPQSKTSASALHKKRRPAQSKTKNEEEDNLNDILAKYRDRAKERREGDEITQFPPEADALQATAGYRAVAPDFRTNKDIAERRKQMIEESKYLGGDMEHTHLVKGLDYALLQKVRSEIASKQKEDDDLEAIYTRGERLQQQRELEATFKTPIAKNVYRTLFIDDRPRVNELFAPRRMAYVMELEEDLGGSVETDIPTTMIRSKADCPRVESSTTLTPNDMVIQKLTQVLSYLRTDSKKKKKGGKDRVDDTKPNLRDADLSIYENTGEYVPKIRRSEEVKREKPDSYFDKPSAQEKERNTRDTVKPGRVPKNSNGDQKIDSRLKAGWAPADLTRESQQEAGVNPQALSKEEKDKGMGSVFKRDHDPLSTTRGLKDGVRLSAKGNADSYAECYPGGYDTYDQDEEDEDFSKMDLGNKKGPVRRWDFETEGEYEDYMSKREAMPKAAFQYGVKMDAGRKTRKAPGGVQRSEKDEKAKLNREWQKISQIISKRKGGDEGGGSKKAKF